MFILMLLVSFLVPNEAARILAIWPIPSLSHQVVFRPLMLELAKRGHEVVVLTTDPIKNDLPANFTEIDLHELSYNYWRKEIVPKIDTKNSFQFLVDSLYGIVDIFGKQIESKQVQDLIKSGQKFDLIFVEAMVKSGAVFSHVFNAPVILFSSFASLHPQLDIIGAPTHFTFFPEINRKRINNPTLLEKFEELYYDLKYRLLIYKLKVEENAMIRKNFGPDAPLIDDLWEYVHMLFLNVHPLWTANRPMPPSVVYTGGIHVNPERPLPADLKSYLDNSKNGVIYVSFGTNVDPTSFSAERVRTFCEVFSKLPYDVLWKWNADELPGKPANVKISKWLPQSDLLRHPKVKAYIMQGGLQSTDEAITAEVPLIAFPFLGDQWYNAQKYQGLGIGLELDFDTFTSEDLERSIRAVTEDKSYKENIKRLKSVMHDQKESPLERAVWWTEHLLRHGGTKHLRSGMAGGSWSEYLLLDMVVAGLAAILVVLSSLLFVLYKVYSFFSSGKSKLKKN